MDWEQLNEVSDKVTVLEETLDSLNTKLDEWLDKKKAAIAKFEHMMGAALRESYWQPEDEYQDNGNQHQETLKLYFNSMFHDVPL